MPGNLEKGYLKCVYAQADDTEVVPPAVQLDFVKFGQRGEGTLFLS